MSAYVLGVSAESDLNEIWEYIARDSLDAADRWIRTPGMGHRRDDLTKLPVLFWTVGEYLIVYQLRSGSVEIVAVTQGAREIPVFLQQSIQ